MMENRSRAANLVIPIALRLDVTLPVIGFALPLVLSGPQLVTGTIVNTLLFLYALRVPTKRYGIMCALPSLGAVANGVVFGTLTPYLLYFLPFIWIGNVVLVSVIRRTRHTNRIIMIASAAILKSALLFLVAMVLTRYSFVPTVFLTAMGIVQFLTAVVGGILAVSILSIVWRK